jgi:hypothetical protein
MKCPTCLGEGEVDEVDATEAALDARELATVLAALRNWQTHLCVNDGLPGAEFAEHFEGIDPMTDEEIDELCERLNCGEDDS